MSIQLKQKVLAWPKVKDLKSTSKIVAHYQKVGTYLGKEIDCDVTFSNFVAHAGVNQDGLAKTINGKSIIIICSLIKIFIEAFSCSQSMS